MTEAEGTIQENGTTVNSYSNRFTYSAIANIMKKLQVVKVAGKDDPGLTYYYSYRFVSTKKGAK
jgi:hypothetical protein